MINPPVTRLLYTSGGVWLDHLVVVFNEGHSS